MKQLPKIGQIKRHSNGIKYVCIDNSSFIEWHPLPLEQQTKKIQKLIRKNKVA